MGTDDGNLQITRDGGKTWTNVVGNVPGMPKFSWVSWVEASRYAEGTAYVTFDRHTFGDMKPYAFRTTDYGKTWTPLTAQESGARGYAHVIKEDTVKPDLLFLGTEFGLWISNDGGQHWARYRGSEFPSVAVRDIVVHPRENDLVLATHGRGIWVIDDITPLRALTPELMQQQVSFIAGRPTIQYINAEGGWPEGDETYTGPSRPQQALINYYQRTRHIFGDLKIEIFDAAGNLVDTVSPGKRRGLNRATWPMRLKPPRVPPAASAVFGASYGPRVLPGKYTVKMTKGGQVYTTELNIELDPRAKYNLEERRAQFDLVMKIYRLLGHMSWAVDNMVRVRDGANQRASKLAASDALRKKLESLAGQTDALRGKIVATKEGGAITGEERLREFLGSLYGDVNGYLGKPTQSQIERTDVLGRELEDVIHDFDKLTAGLPQLNQQLQGKKLEPIRLVSEADWQKQQDGAPAGGAAQMMLREMD